MLRLCNIVKDYPTATTTVQALRGISLSFRESEFVAILGPSGCGKTTMLNIIGGLDRYTSGDLLIGGVSTAAFDDLHWDAYRNATIGFVFQSYNLIPHLTVMENVELALSLVGEKKKTRRAKVVAALHMVGMDEEINKRPNQLSGGQMQRVAIARAIVNDPKIILADEPTGALDSELSVQVMDILKEISKTRLVIMVTHNAELAYQYCSRICRFKDGSLIEDTNPYSSEDEERENSFDLLATPPADGDAEGEEQTADLQNGDEDEIQTPEDIVTTDTLSLESDDVNPDLSEKQAQTEACGEALQNEDAPGAETAASENEAAPQSEQTAVPMVSEEADDIDYESLFTRSPAAVKAKKVSNRKRKKQMKRNESASDPTLNRLGINSLNKRKRKQKKQMKKAKTFKPTSMSAGMAFGLSLRNLVAKRKRTFFTMFAGSIGIIGLGLVLAISNGFSVFVDNMQTEMLAGVPVGVYEYNVKVNVIDNILSSMTEPKTDDGAFPDSDKVTLDPNMSSSADAITELLQSFFEDVSRNELTEEFCNYMLNYDNDYGAMNVFYGTRFNLISRYLEEDENGIPRLKFKDASQMPSDLTTMSIAMTVLGDNGIQPKFWQQLVGDKDYMSEQYDVLAGSYPKEANQLALCVNEYNQVNTALVTEFFGAKLYKLNDDGTLYLDSDYRPQEINPNELTFDDFIGRKIRLVFNDDYYKRCIEPGWRGKYFFESPGVVNNDPYRWGYSDSDALRQIYEATSPSNGGNGIDLEVTAVIRPKKDAKAAYVSAGSLCYTPQLGKLVAENAYDSEIAQFQRELSETYRPNTSGFMTGHIALVDKDTLESKMLTDEDLASTSILGAMSNSLELTTFEEAIGSVKKPSYIAVYPETYQQKIDICNYINKWNETHKTEYGADTIGYFDVSEMMVHSLNMIINLVSMLLIAVASISLVVSTVMIGVITSNSVIERTREIGILRALGARKMDIRHVFLAETSLIGLAAGLLGIVLTYIISPIISLVIGALSGVSNLLHFNPLHAFLLVVLSLLLTVLSGIIPAINASRKNVVDALRVD